MDFEKQLRNFHLKYSSHFIIDVLPKRQYLSAELISEIINNPLKMEIQEDGKIKIWGFSSKHNKYIRIILLDDCETIHTGFFDRNFKL